VSAWQTVYDATTAPFQWGNAGEGLVALAILALGFASFFALRRARAAWRVVALAVALSGSAAYVAETVRHRREHDRCVTAAERREGELIEGVVEDYRPLDSPWHRPATESFVVNGTRITYPLLSSGCGFHRTHLENSPIHDGVRVRLRYWQGQILRLEIERPDALGQPQR
jgi:hypothetical protein